MFDASAKPPSGILSGNGNQYGDFDECLSINEAVRGKYCLASLEVTIAGDQNLDRIDNMIHSGHYIKSNFTDVSIITNITFLFSVYINDLTGLDGGEW